MGANARLVDNLDIPVGTLGNPFIVEVTEGGTGLPATIITGQAKIAVTGTAVQLGANALVNGIVITAGINNAAAGSTAGPAGVTNVVDGTGNGQIMLPGASVSFAVQNSSAVYVNGTAGDIFSFGGN